MNTILAHLPTPIKHIGIGGIAKTQSRPGKIQETLEEYSSVSNDTVRVSTHLASIKKLPLCLLFLPLLGGHIPSAQVNLPIQKCQCDH